MPWKKWFALGCSIWENDKGDKLTLINRNRWTVEINNKPIEYFEEKSDALKYIEKYMKEND